MVKAIPESVLKDPLRLVAVVVASSLLLDEAVMPDRKNHPHPTHPPSAGWSTCSDEPGEVGARDL